MKRQRNKRLKTVGFVLKFPQANQMIDPMERFFHVPVQHRAIGFHPQLMGRSMDVNPVVPVRFMFANLIANFRMKNFRTTARHAAQPGID